MALLELKNVNKYFFENNKEKYILKNINIKFPKNGLFTIEGKSGCGKSTLLNLISLIEKPSSGKILFNNRNILKLNEKKKSNYRNKAIGLVFQNYNLLEEETALYNVMLPLLLNGVKRKTAIKEAEQYFDSIGLPKEIRNKKCKDLSGGEKQRIGILRAIVNKPYVLLCDEPTGALDSVNSEMIMELLKRISKDTLVIMVTHNHELAKKYSDTIMTVKNNRLIYPEFKTNSDEINYKWQTPFNINNWSNEIVKNNLLKRKKRNIINFISLTFSIWISLLAFGFSNGASNSIEIEANKQFDKGNLTLYKSYSQNIDGSSLKLTKTVKASNEEIAYLNPFLDKFQIKNNISALFLQNCINFNGIKKDNINFIPIYNMENNYYRYSNNNFINLIDFKDVLINKKLAILINDSSSINFTSSYIYNYPTQNQLKPYISDYFILDVKLNIVDVIDEMSFLNVPTIYYSYELMEEYLNSIYLSNLSKYEKYDISWKNIFDFADSNEEINSYSHYLFLKDLNDVDKIGNIISELPSPYKIDSNYLTKKNTLLDLIKVSSFGINMFIYICIVSSVLLLFIISFSNYSQDKKQVAILRSIGGSNDNIHEIYFQENFIISCLALISGILFSLVMIKPINIILFKITNLKNLIDFKKFSFINKPYLLIIILFVLVVIIVYFSSLMPTIFKKNKSIKKELSFE